MAKDDGGPAFPQDLESNGYGRGMTLRDWFAGQVIVGHFHIDQAVRASFAKQAYEMADAMLAERDR